MKRNDAPSNDEESGPEEEESILAAHPREEAFAQRDGEASPRSGRNGVRRRGRGVLDELRRGQAFWVQCLTIHAAAALVYSYRNVGSGANVQIAIMSVITLVGATPLSSTHLLPASIGAFVGGHNIIGSTGPIEGNTEIPASNYLWLLVLSVVVGLVWRFLINNPHLKLLDGYGGRLGTTTFLGMNLVMLTIYGPARVVDWDRYYYGFGHVIHTGEEDSSPALATAWSWTKEADAAAAYVLGVLWLGGTAGGMRVLHDDYVRRCGEGNERAPAPLDNVLVPAAWALLSMLAVNATGYEHATALYNGFAVGSYVAMASLNRIPSTAKFACVSMLAAWWGLAMTPLFVGFAGKSGFTSMLGHATQIALDARWLRISRGRRRRGALQRQQLDERLRLEMQEGHEAPRQSSSEDEGDGREAPPSPRPRGHRPRREEFYTKQQRRQHAKLRHLQEAFSEQGWPGDPPRLHHRAWSALPRDGDGVWEHSLESRGEGDGLA